MIIETLLFVLALIIGFFFFKKDDKLPPGPLRIPFVGNVPVIYGYQGKQMCEKYGDVFMIQFGLVKMLYLADYKKSKEAFSKMEFADRVDWQAFKINDEEIEREECGGIIFSNGSRWHNTRRFLLRNLRDLGMGKSKIEGMILREIENLVEDFSSLTKEPSKLPFSINMTILNVIWQLVATQRYEYSASEVANFMRGIDETLENFFTIGITSFFPFVKYIIPEGILNYLIGRNKFLKVGRDFKMLVQATIDEHLANLDPNNPSDLMDEYLVEMKEKKSKEFSHFSNDDLVRTTFDLFVAGNETTASMIRWILFYMAKFPHIQEKIHKLIDENVPADRLPGLEDREKLAYLDATINEVQRHSTLLPLGIMRFTNKDVTFDEYHIPKGTMVQSLAEVSHKDPAYWKNPDEVDPTRFLDSDGKFVPQPDGFQPFGLGKRQCLGEHFARMELYLIVAALLQNFAFSPPEGREIDITPKRTPIMNKPKNDQKLLIKSRH